MEQGRKPRMIGEQLLLGGAEYRIEAVEGYGGSTIVYRASYQDGLSSDRRHEGPLQAGRKSFYGAVPHELL